MTAEIILEELTQQGWDISLFASHKDGKVRWQFNALTQENSYAVFGGTELLPVLQHALEILSKRTPGKRSPAPQSYEQRKIADIIIRDLSL